MTEYVLLFPIQFQWKNIEGLFQSKTNGKMFGNISSQKSMEKLRAVNLTLIFMQKILDIDFCKISMGK